mgnify:CR=1 FL=1
MSKKPLELTDDGELEQPVAVEEKPKRKRGESPLQRSVNVPVYLLLIVLALVLISGLVWLAGNLANSDMSLSPDEAAEMATNIGIVFGAQAPPPLCSFNPPQGERVAYVSSADSSVRVRSLSTGDDCILVTFLGDNGTEIALAPDGERVAYTHREGQANDLWVMNVNGTGGINLTAAHDSYVRYPAWSADGTRLAFTAVIGNSPHIAVMNADGTNLVTLVQGAMPAWSPDSSRLAFSSGDGDSGYLAVMNVDGSNLRRVTNSTTREAFAAWSPDGTHLLFARADETVQYKDVYTVAVDDPQQEHRLIAHFDYSVYDLAWLAEERFAYIDGSSIALHTRLFPPNDGATGDTVILEGVLGFDWWMPPQ